MADKSDQPIFTNVPTGSGAATHVLVTEGSPASNSGAFVHAKTLADVAGQISEELGLGTAAEAAVGDFAAAVHEHSTAAVTSGTFDSARIPVAGTGSVGGVTRAAGSGGSFVTGWDENGVPQYAVPEGGGEGSVTSVAVSGTDGIEVDSGSPITTTGTIQLGVNAATLRTTINVENGATADQTGAEILAALLPVDGPASGLDADTVDGQHAAAFALATHNQDASTINSGTLAAARLPAPTTTALGGVMRTPGGANQVVIGINVDGSLEYGVPDIGGTIVTLIENYTELEMWIDDAIAAPTTTFRGLVISGVPMEDNLSKFNTAGTNKSWPSNAVAEFTRDGYLDFGRNVRQITQTAVTSSGGMMLFTLADHGMATNDVVFFRSNGPLPQKTSLDTDRILRDTAYNVIVNNANSFFIATIEAPATPIPYFGTNFCDIWIFRGFQAAAVDTINYTITVPNHGLLDGMRIRFKIEAGQTWTGGATEGQNQSSARYFVRDATTNSFSIATTPGGAVEELSGAPSRGVMFVAAFEVNMLGEPVAETQIFRNYYVGTECALSGTEPGLPSVFGLFRGRVKKAVWWGCVGEAIPFQDALTSGTGMDGAANPKFNDQTECIAAAVYARYYVIGGSGKGNNTDVNVYYSERWGGLFLEFGTGLYRMTDRVRFYRDSSQTPIGAGSRSTLFMSDIWEDNPSGAAASTDAPGVDYCCFQIENGATQSLRWQAFGIIGTTRQPASCAAIWVSGGGGMDDQMFRDIYIANFPRYGVYFGPANVNHPTFQGCSVQHGLHPYSVPVIVNASGGASRFDWQGGTLNDGSTPTDLFAAFDFRTTTEATIRNVHFEFCQHGFYLDNSAAFNRLTLDNCDFTPGEARDFVAVPAGSNFVDCYALRKKRGTNGVTLIPLRTITLSGFAAGTVTFNIASGHNFTAGDFVLLWNTDGLLDGSGNPISGLRMLASVAATTVTVTIPGTGSGVLAGTAWMGLGETLGQTYLRQGMRVIFQEGGPGEDAVLTGLALNTPYYLSGGACASFNWKNFTDDGGDLLLDFGSVAHGIEDGAPVYWVPSLAPTLTNTHMPTGIGYNSLVYHADVISATSLKLFTDVERTTYLAFPADYSRLTGNGKLGDEARYHLVSHRFKLTASRGAAHAGTPITTVSTGEAVMMTVAREFIALGRGEHLIEGLSLRNDPQDRPADENAIGVPSTFISNNGQESWPVEWAAPTEGLYYGSVKGTFTGSATDDVDVNIHGT